MICWYVEPVRVSGPTPYEGRPFETDLTNHTCNETNNIVVQDTSEEDWQYRISGQGSVGGNFNGTEIGLSLSIEEAMKKKRVRNVELPKTRSPCQHWEVAVIDKFTTETYQKHLRSWTLFYGKEDWRSGNITTCNSDAIFGGSIPATVDIVVDTYKGVRVRDTVPLTQCTEFSSNPDPTCPTCRKAASTTGGSTGTSTGSSTGTSGGTGKVSYKDDDGSYRDPDQPDTGALRDVAEHAYLLGDRPLRQVQLPATFAYNKASRVLRWSQGEVSVSKGQVTYKPVDGEVVSSQTRPLVLEDGTSVSPAGLVVFSNGAIAKFPAEDHPPVEVVTPQ